MMRRLIGFVAAGLLAISSAHAGPITVDPSVAGSSVSAGITSSSCVGCFVNATLSDGLDDVIAQLDVGDSVTFDFFDLIFGGLFGTAEIAVDATLGLASPNASVSGNGIGLFASFLYIFNGVQLAWIQPGDIDLGDGTFLDISFDDLFESVFGGSTTVSATITRRASVPEPGTVALLSIGLFGLCLAARRRRQVGVVEMSCGTA